MNGVVTRLGFSIWAKNMSEKAFNSLHRDLIKTRVLSNQANGSFRSFMRDMNRETKAARGFGTVMMTSILGPLAASGGIFAGAAAGIAGVGAAIAGAMALGMVAYDKYTKFAEGAKTPMDKLKAQADEFMTQIAPAFAGAWESLLSTVDRVMPVAVDMFKDLGRFASPLIDSIGRLVEKVLPSLGRLFDAVGPHLPTFVSAFDGIAAVVDNLALSLDKLAPSVAPIIGQLLDLVAGIIGPKFFGALGPLLDGLNGFFEAAKPGFFKFMEDFATALNNLAPVLPALGDFLGRVLAAAGPVLVSLSESLADKLPGILNGLAGFAEFLGTILDNKAVTDVLVDIGMAYLLISGALKAVNAVMAVSTVLTLGTIPGGGPAAKAGGSKGALASSILSGVGLGGGKGPKPPTKLSSSWNKWATGLGGLLAKAVKVALIAGIALWGADELSQAMNGESLGDDFLGVRQKFNETYNNKGFWAALWASAADEAGGENMADAFAQIGKTGSTGVLGTKDPNATGLQTLVDPEFAPGMGIQSDEKQPHWMRVWDKNLDAFNANLGKNLSGAMDNFTQFFENIGTNLDRAWANMQAWLSRAGENVKTWLMNLGKNISGTADNIAQFFENIGRNIGRTFGNIGNWFHNLWTNISRGVNNIKQFFANLSTNIANVWKNIRVGIHNAWVWLLNNVIYRIRDFFTKTIPQAATHLRLRVIDAWNTLRARLGAAKDWIKTNIVDKIGNFFSKTIPNAASTMAKKVRDAFNRAKDWVGEVWNKLGNVVKAPVNWVITNVYNNGIRALWNKVAKAVGASELGKMSTIGSPPKVDSRSASEKTRDLLTAKSMAVGGPVFGGVPGIDTVPAWLNNGEHVLTTEEVRRAGGHNQILKLRSALMGGQPVQGGNMTGQFKDGGFWGKALSFGKNLFDGDWIRGALGSMAEPVLGVIEKGVDGMSDQPAFSGMLKKAALKPLDWIRDWLAKDDEKYSALSDDGGGLYKSMFNWIKTRVPGTHLMSGLRQGDWGYHGLGKAVDLGFSDRSEYGPGMKGLAGKAFNLIKSTFKPNIAELIWDFAGSKAVWNGNDHFFTGASAGPGTHNNHIHWAMARAASGISPLGGTSSGYKGGGADAWRGVVNGVLNELGLSRDAHLGNVLRAIQKESGGNPRAINNWDSNAAAGIPSKGLLQTIDPTFNAWAGKYKSRGVYDPYANVYAAIRYARNRYGAGWSSRMAQPGGYADGTMSASPGWHWVGERGRELVNFKGGEQVLTNTQSEKLAGGGDVHVHFDGPFYGDKKAVTEMVIEAVHEAKRQNRM